MKRSIAVTIAGQRISLKSDADEAYVQLLAGFVDEKVRELQQPGSRAGAQKVALLAALRIADDLFRERRQRADLRRRVRERVQRMLDDVGRATAHGNHPTRT